MAINTFKRYEKKYKVTDKQLEEMMPTILEHMNFDKYCVGGAEYGVYNIYFDTQDSYLIRESLQKPRYKEKIRLRTYCSPAQDNDTCFLELKKKCEKIVFKRRITTTLSQAEEFLMYGTEPNFDEKDYINNQVLAEIRTFMKMYSIVPTQYISYKRFAFFGKDDSSFRMTFDRDITTRRNDLSLRYDSYGEKLLGEHERLLEIKINGAMPMWLATMLSEMGIFTTSFSKYGTAYSNKIKEDMGLVTAKSKPEQISDEGFRHAV
ncbi:MAG: polyphosphate polymerase domain-containing protein [Oscillospiraceae bacterium]|nr:polyphosphate polymerase domain-containing protein [Oscillospiraceae bacterium]